MAAAAAAGRPRPAASLALVLLLCACHVLRSDACIDSCVCIARKMICNNLKLSLPVAVSEQYIEIEFRQIQFPSKNLLRRNLTGLGHLTSLTISASGFETIEPGAFAGLTKLTKLDLSDNNLGRLMPRTFDGLSVEHLFLNRNPRLDLSARDALSGLRTSGLYLSQCGLSDITADSLRPVMRGASLRTLWLDGNGIETLDPGLEQLLQQLRSVKLGDNPLDCGCRMMWLKRLLDDRSAGQAENIFVGNQLRCALPLHLAGSFLSQVSIDSMQCRQQSLDMSFTPVTGELRCESRAAPQASLIIRGPSGMPSLNQAAQGTGEINVVTLIVPGAGSSAGAAASSGVYSCTSISIAGNLSVAVNITLPSPQPALPVHNPTAAGAPPASAAAAAPEQDRAGSGGAPATPPSSAYSGAAGTVCPEVAPYVVAGSAQPSDKPPAKADSEGRQIDILTAKYFSLIDILCATLGTFLATLTVTVLVLHFCVYRRRSGALPSSPMGSPPPSDYGTGSVKGYAPPLPAGQVGALPMRPMPQSHFVRHKPMYDPDNHYMTTNLEEVEFLHPTCQACTMSKIS